VGFHLSWRKFLQVILSPVTDGLFAHLTRENTLQKTHDNSLPLGAKEQERWIDRPAWPAVIYPNLGHEIDKAKVTGENREPVVLIQSEQALQPGCSFFQQAGYGVLLQSLHLESFPAGKLP
jgi:hypothetical protein